MKKRIFVVICALLLCVTASFAWLSNFQANYVTNLKVDYENGALSVVGLGFSGYIETKDASGEFVRIPDGEAFKFDAKQMVPDSITPFNIKINNKSATESRKAKLSVAIRIDPVEMGSVNVLDVLYLEVVAGSGFVGTNNYHVFTKLSDAQIIGDRDSGEYLLVIYGNGSEIIIPPTEEGQYVTLACSFYYDQNATAEYQNKSVEAIQFRLE